MRRFAFVVGSEVGLHARPAAELAARAGRFACDIRLHAHGGSCDAKSVFAILALDVAQGATVTVVCEGPDEAEAEPSLRELCATL